MQSIERPTEVQPYKPPPLDEAGWARDIGIGVGIVVAVVVVIGVIVRVLLDRRLRRGAKLVDLELVTLTGTVRATDGPLTAPLSGKRCVAHRSRARVDTDSIVDEHTGFALDTDRGTIAISDDPLRLDIIPERVVPPIEARERAFLERFALADRHHNAHFDEIAIEPGAKITIRGVLRIDVDPAARDERGYRDAAPSRMRLVAPEGQAIKIVRVWQ